MWCDLPRPTLTWLRWRWRRLETGIRAPGTLWKNRHLILQSGARIRVCVESGEVADVHEKETQEIFRFWQSTTLSRSWQKNVTILRVSESAALENCAVKNHTLDACCGSESSQIEQQQKLVKHNLKMWSLFVHLQCQQDFPPDSVCPWK